MDSCRCPQREGAYHWSMKQSSLGGLTERPKDNAAGGCSTPTTRAYTLTLNKAIIIEFLLNK